MDRRSALAAAAVTALAAASGRSAVARPADAPRPSPSRPSVVETDDGAGLFYNDWGTGKPVLFRSELARGGEARGFSALTNRGGVDFMTFTAASGDSCVGIRRDGPSMGAEYGWVLNAVRCEPGILAGSATGAVLEWVLPAQAMQDWGWRVPFWIGLLIGLAGLVLRHGLKEEAVAPGKRPRERAPLATVFRQHWRLLAYLAGVSVFGAVGFYLMFVYIVSWLQFADDIAPAQALTINTISMVLLIPAEIGMAWLSDRFGRRNVLLLVTGLAVVAAWPLFRMMHGPKQGMILAGQLGFVVLVGGYYGCLPAFMVETVAREVRCTAVALGYNVSLGLLGGLSPLAATWLVHRTGNDYTPAWMIMAAAVITFVVLLLRRPEPGTS